MITIVEDPNFISSSHLIYDLWQQKKDVTAVKQTQRSLRCADYNDLKQICHLKCTFKTFKIILLKCALPFSYIKIYIPLPFSV